MKEQFAFENVTDKHMVLKELCIGIERHLNLANNGDKGSFISVATTLRQCSEYIAKQYLFYFGESLGKKGRKDSLFEMLKRLEPLFQLYQKDIYGKEFMKTMHRIRSATNPYVHLNEDSRIRVMLLTGLAEDLDALLPQFYVDIPKKLKKPRTEQEVEENASEEYLAEQKRTRENKEKMREYQNKSLWKLACDYWSPVKRNAPWVEFDAADYKEYPLLMKTVYRIWYDEQNRALQEKMYRASLIARMFFMLALVLWIAVTLGGMALIIWLFLPVMRTFLHQGNMAIAFILLVAFGFALFYFVFLSCKAFKKFGQKLL